MEGNGGTYDRAKGLSSGRSWSLAFFLGLCPPNDPRVDPVTPRKESQDETPVPESELPQHAFEVALSDDAVWGGYRSAFRRGSGHVEVEALASEDDDYAGSVRVMRFAQPADFPLGLGVGLGLFAGFVDEPDAEVYALTIGGAADDLFATEVPLRTGIEVSWAPDGTSFDDGEGVLDVRVRGELEISSFAAAFLGYRWLEVELDDESENLDRGFQIGVRIGF